MKKENLKYSIISLFGGCGGLDLGFNSRYFKITHAFDNDPAAVQCYNHNLQKVAECIDVTSKEFDKLINKIKKCDIVLGGFPCQGFSKSGPKKEDDPRNLLYRSMLKTVESLKPKIFVAENVDGMAQNFKGSYVETIKKDFENCNPSYKVFSTILNAINYGVPQYRRRIFFVGIQKNLNGTFEWPKPTHLGGSRNGEFKISNEISKQLTFEDYNKDLLKLDDPKTIKQAIGDLLTQTEQFTDHHYINKIKSKDLHIIKKIKEGQKLCNVRFSDTSVYTWEIPDAFGKTTKKEKIILETIGKNRRKRKYGNIPNGNPLPIDEISSLSGLKISKSELDSLTERNFLKVIDNKWDLKGAMFCSGLYKRPNWNEPSPTVITFFHSPRYFLHPKKDRPFTIRESARLQSFPDTFEFKKSGINDIDSYRLIGNAVPPDLAKALSESILKILRKNFK